MLIAIAANQYPGGSQADTNSIGFDWVNNYWCNLFSKQSMNGAINPARPIAIIATSILCCSLIVFFFQFAELMTQNRIWKTIIKSSGFLSMGFAMLIFTPYHDLMTIISSLFGVPLVIGIIHTINGSKFSYYKIAGLFCLLLLTLNNVIYYSTYFIEWLPLLQKITFVFIMIWILGLNYEMRKMIILKND